MTIRAFIGLPLPEVYQKKLDRIKRELGSGLKSKLGWTAVGNWHLTLKFLGDIRESMLGAVKESLGEIRFKPFILKAGGGGFFPLKPPPKVIWAGLEAGAPESVSLALEIEGRMADLGFAPEPRPFSPHLTLARVKWAEKDDWQALLSEIKILSWPEIRMEGFVLWKSELGKGGGGTPRYTELARFGCANL